MTLSENVNYLVYTVAIGAREEVDTDKSAEWALHCAMMLRGRRSAGLMVSVIDNQNRREIKKLWATSAFFLQCFNDLISLRVLS